jgi:adenine-specific DNA-methyltransferase
MDEMKGAIATNDVALQTEGLLQVSQQDVDEFANAPFPVNGKTTRLYKTTLINNRRYLGNKYKLLNFITKVVKHECPDIRTVADIMSGTGSVAWAFRDKSLITNDILYFNYLCHYAWFSTEKYNKEKIIDYVVKYNQAVASKENYVSLNFSGTYFSKADCRKIGYIRQHIENEHKIGKINFREKALLITSLIYAMDKIANTCGHYDAYRKGAKFEKSLELRVPLASNSNKNNQCFNEDANELVKTITADLVYIDPPYNSRQYCDAYHLLENIARWEKPQVFGEARKMDRMELKSDYCSANATKAFKDLIKSIKAKYILLSYNNMAEKGNARSNARITDEDIIRILSIKGEVKVFTEKYKAFTTGKSDNQENAERLFLCICNNTKMELIQSPLNYTGGKYKLLNQILPLFPKNISTFVDVFCGGCNVGANVSCKNIVFNDINPKLLYMFNTFKNLDKEEIFYQIDKIIKEYDLSQSNLFGYGRYKNNGADGLGEYNKNAFLKLRGKFNSLNEDYFYYITLFVLITFAFNNQIRFNKDQKFNLPVGKRDFNAKMREKLSLFIDRLKNTDCTFTNKDFRNIDVSQYAKDSFFYFDPPYLITTATYNEQDGWTENDEKDLLAYLDNLHDQGYRFALSNVLQNKGKTNRILSDWLSRNHEKYAVIHLKNSYSNSNYQAKNKAAFTDEVLILNYGVRK